MHFVRFEVYGFSHRESARRESLNAVELQKTPIRATDELVMA
jgi:hypothetical protein